MVRYSLDRMSFATGLTSQPSVQYRKNRYFYLMYDIPYIVAFAGISLALHASGWRGVIASWQPAMWLILPVVAYLHVLASVFIHNASHLNFPRAINRVLGEVLGVLVVVRFANWEILHVRHHRHADDPARDPHAMQPSFWRFLFETMVLNLERQLQNEHYDRFGDTPANHRYERVRSILSFSGEASCLVFWYYLLGFQAFVFLFVPAQLIGWTVVSHFNWVTHNGHSKTRDYHPINLDTGPYWIGNRIWFGLYMHANHHKRACLFNPMHFGRVLAAQALRASRATP